MTNSPFETAFTIDTQLKSLCPELTLGIIYAAVSVTKKNVQLWEDLNNSGKRQAATVGGIDELSKIPAIASARNAYRACGKEPQKYRVSSEALLRRIFHGKGLYQVNTVVDVNNLVSIESKHSVGSYDLEKVQGNVTFRIGNSGESYKGIGKEIINIERLPVFVDAEGPFGSPTSDSENAMIRLETSKIAMVVIAFSGGEGLDRYLQLASENLEKYSEARDIRTQLVS